MPLQAIASSAAVAAVVAGVVSAFSTIVTRKLGYARLTLDKALQDQKLRNDALLATKRLELDERLAIQKSKADLELAEKKLDLERSAAERARLFAFAEQVLSDFYRARDLIQKARGNSMSGRPVAREREEWETPDSQINKDMFSSAEIELERHGEFFASFRSRKHQALAVLGEAAAEPFEMVQNALDQIEIATRRLIAEENRKKPPATAVGRLAYSRSEPPTTLSADQFEKFTAAVGLLLAEEEDPWKPYLDSAVEKARQLFAADLLRTRSGPDRPPS